MMPTMRQMRIFMSYLTVNIWLGGMGFESSTFHHIWTAS